MESLNRTSNPSVDRKLIPAGITPATPLNHCGVELRRRAMTNSKLPTNVEVSEDNPPNLKPKEHKIVINLGSRKVIKGYFAFPEGQEPASMFEGPVGTTPKSILVRLLESDQTLDIPLSGIKAIFFVKSFRGNPTRRALRFYANGPDPGRIWAEVRFKDNEAVEGKIENTATHLLSNGFLLHPSDSGGNNLLIYVNKSAVESYRVLGVKAHREPGD
jgi:hypothetical protein